jgi:D-sedoheptulose 7-phosphate isomerase/D-glycero-D-manno-heptose 1,7-bisphosphate phosphatase
MARAVGARPFLVTGGTGGTGTVVQCDATSVPDLGAAVDLILAEHEASLPARAQAVPGFPSRSYDDAATYAEEYSRELARAMASLDTAQFEAAARILNAAYDRGATVFSCGNGGSAAIANHFQCDHVKGVRTGTGLLTRVQSLSTNVEILSAIANDISYDNVFDFQLESLARPGDVLFAVSSSGRSPNIVKALEWCAENGVETVALTGFTGGASRDLATVSIHVDCRNYGVVEDAHQACMHLLAQYVRQSRMSANDIAAQAF